MKIKLESGIEYWVSWYHENFLSTPLEKSLTSSTQCIVENKMNTHIIGKGIAFLGKKEKQFNKDFGRKISLKKAMNEIGLNKETRTLFWNEYHKITNKLQRIK